MKINMKIVCHYVCACALSSQLLVLDLITCSNLNVNWIEYYVTLSLQFACCVLNSFIDSALNPFPTLSLFLCEMQAQKGSAWDFPASTSAAAFVKRNPM